MISASSLGTESLCPPRRGHSEAGSTAVYPLLPFLSRFLGFGIGELRSADARCSRSLPCGVAVLRDNVSTSKSLQTACTRGDKGRLVLTLMDS